MSTRWARSWDFNLASQRISCCTACYDKSRKVHTCKPRQRWRKGEKASERESDRAIRRESEKASLPFSILHSPFSILYSLFSILYSLLSTLYSLFSILYSLFSTLYSLLSILYSPFSTLHSLLSILYSPLTNHQFYSLPKAIPRYVQPQRVTASWMGFLISLVAKWYL